MPVHTKLGKMQLFR